jgi:tRNA pseudouridine55 synthase
MEITGVICVDKHIGVTSHDIIYAIRRIYKTKQVGHTGTLDPIASGVLVVLIGRAVKTAEYLGADGSKIYKARLKFGLTTDTGDITGKVLTRNGGTPSIDTVSKACEKFRGKIIQIPPMYSALKVGGQKLVDLARRGIETERAGREITIYALDVKPCDDPSEYEMTVECSRGTYIRTLCEDIGAECGCGAVMAALTRTKNGAFTLDMCSDVKTLAEMTDSERAAAVIPLDKAFQTLKRIDLPDFYARLAQNGLEIYHGKIGVSADEGQLVRLYHNGVFFAIARSMVFPDGPAFKPEKKLVL